VAISGVHGVSNLGAAAISRRATGNIGKRKRNGWRHGGNKNMKSEKR